jgi:translation initiation factor 1
MRIDQPLMTSSLVLNTDGLSSSAFVRFCLENNFPQDDPCVSSPKKRMSGTNRIPTGRGESFGHNPFGALSSEGLAPGPESSPADAGQPVDANLKRKSRGRVDIIRQTAGRGGKTVTVVKGFVGIGLPEKEQLAKAMQRACGTGGTVKNGQIEIQGDKRAEVARILSEANFRPVFAGG